MTSRRRFIQSGIAVSAIASPVLSVLPSIARATGVAALRLDCFVFDNRFAEAVELARHAAHLGIPLAETSGDLTDLWYDRLDLQWKDAPAALAGITTRRGLFVLETLAADHGMRVAYRGEHGVAQGAYIAHRLFGPEPLIAQARSSPDGGVFGSARTFAALGEQLARAMTCCPIGTLTAADVSLRTPAEESPARDEPLFSWIIAPRSVVALAV